MSRIVVGLARLSARHPRVVVALWCVAVVGLLAAARLAGPGLPDDVEVPGSDSAAAAEILDRAGEGTGGDAEDGAAADAPEGAVSPVLVATSGPVADRADDVAAFAADLRVVDGVLDVQDPLAAPGAAGAGRDPAATSTQLRVTASDDVDRRGLADAVAGARDDGLEVGVGYPLLRDLEPGMDSRPSEVIGVVTAVVVLLLVLGTAVGMAIPVVTALLTVAAGLAALRLLDQVVAIPSVVPTLATMIGLGVGIDYALFQVSRFREVLRTGVVGPDAVVATARTAGDAVAFAGATVAVAISALAVTGVSFVAWLGFGTAVVVVVVLVGALTLTPALLTLAGTRLAGRRARGGRSARGAATASAPGPAPAADPEVALDRTRWAAVARAVVRRPWLSLVASLVVLGALAAPAATLSLGQSSDADRPVGTERRTTYDLTSAQLGEGANGSLVVAAELSPPAGPDDPRPAALAAAIRDVPGVAEVAPPQVAADGATMTVRVEPVTGPADPATADTVAALRDLPALDGVTAHVGGATGVRLDLSDRIAQRLPWLVGATVAIAAVLLVGAFRSVVLPVKAALMDLVSVAAAYGVVTAVFEWGWGASLVGLDGPVAIDAYVPMMLFAVLFGLSMDYEVFLLASVQEHWHATGRTRLSVQRGLASTGRIITAAATIMLAVFGSFVLVDDPVIKVFGVGLAVAVLVDATLVRCVLGPAAMVLMGPWNWWLPRRLASVLR